MRRLRYLQNQLRFWNKHIHFLAWPYWSWYFCRDPKLPDWPLTAPKLPWDVISCPNWINMFQYMLFFIIFLNSWSKNEKKLSLFQSVLSETLFCFANILDPMNSQKWCCIQSISITMDLSFQDKKELFENPIHGCKDIKQIPSLILFGTPCNLT